ncbi:MAG TPA: 2-oxo acid dehydrogenase subunit E2 [Pseudonocardiaceae bacterium]
MNRPTGNEAGRVPAQRRHTLHFLRFVHAASPVYLDTEVDMTRLLAHRGAALGGAAGCRRYSVVSYVLAAVGRVLLRHPDANAAYGGRLVPRIVRYASVDAKLTLDKISEGQRAVLAVVLPAVHASSLAEIQRTVDRLRDSAVAEIPELRRVRLLQRLPWPVGRLAFGLGCRLGRRQASMGTVAVSSLGHRPVGRFFSSGGTAVTVGLGQIWDAAVVRDGQVCVAPLLPLSLTFDHRVLDGALAADVLADLKQTLEELDDLVDDPARASSAAPAKRADQPSVR